jgi:hypothetical protein
MARRVTIAEFSTVLQRLADETPQLVAGAMFEEAEAIITDAKRRTPVDTGALRNSGFVEAPNVSGREIEVRLGFGGPAAPYALFVHETLRATHHNGEAKFLENAMTEARADIAQRMVERVRRGRGGM